MSAKVIALAGASGYVGVAFANAFLDLHAFELRILARESSIDTSVLQDFKKRGASLHSISYEDETSIISALQGVEILVSTISKDGLLSAQTTLVKAAKAAGVSNFFPSEYGGEFENYDSPSPIIQAKQAVTKAARDAGLPTTSLSTGIFPEYCLIPLFGFAFADKKVTIWGDGNAKFSCTTTRDIAQWLAQVLKDTPVAQLQNKRLSIQGDLVSGNEIVKLWEKKHQAKLEVEYRPLEELEQRIKADPNDLLAVLLFAWHSGHLQLKSLNNDLYPGWKPDSVESVL